MTTYTWEFDQNSVKTETIGSNSGVVVQIDWKLKGSGAKDGVDVTVITSGTVYPDTSDLSGFVAFSDLTQAEMETMITESMQAGEISFYQTLLDETISNMDVEEGFINSNVFKPFNASSNQTLPFV
tara:strand:+ start:910 stop:1287 length:378 start_codon:yes stop_codon:yes gene_type:complete